MKYYQLKRQCKFQTTAFHYSPFLLHNGPKRIYASSISKFLYHTQLHTRPAGLLWPSDQSVADAATYTTRKTQETNFHALCGIRSLDPKNEAASDLRLRPRHHRVRLAVSIVSAYYNGTRAGYQLTASSRSRHTVWQDEDNPIVRACGTNTAAHGYALKTWWNSRYNSTHSSPNH